MVLHLLYFANSSNRVAKFHSNDVFFQDYPWFLFCNNPLTNAHFFVNMIECVFCLQRKETQSFYHLYFDELLFEGKINFRSTNFRQIINDLIYSMHCISDVKSSHKRLLCFISFHVTKKRDILT